MAYKEQVIMDLLKKEGKQDLIAAKKLMALLQISNKVVGDAIAKPISL